jgi:hypothetical protein
MAFGYVAADTDNHAVTLRDRETQCSSRCLFANETNSYLDYEADGKRLQGA